jgi:HEAT repeat protein
MPAYISVRLANSLRVDQAEVRAEAAVEALKVLGPAAASLIPELEGLMNDPVHWQISDRATRALPYMGTNALGPLLKALQQPSQICRTHVADAVGDFLELHPDATSAIPVLVSCLSDSQAAVRVASAQALGNPQLPADAILPPLAAALENSDPGTRWNAAFALGKCRSTALAAIPALQRATNDPDYEVRIMAAQSITQILSNTPAH